MAKPKVLIIVSRGVASYLCIGDVDVEVVDEDNIDAGDPRVHLIKVARLELISHRGKPCPTPTA
jgi:hypothetical protein